MYVSKTNPIPACMFDKTNQTQHLSGSLYKICMCFAKAHQIKSRLNLLTTQLLNQTKISINTRNINVGEVTAKIDMSTEHYPSPRTKLLTVGN